MKALSVTLALWGWFPLGLADRINRMGGPREAWQPRLGRDVTRDEAKQIAASVTGFFAVLAEWSRADMPDPANDNGGGATSGDEGVRHDR